MRDLALIVSVITFFAMALVGMACGQTVFSCSIRAILGAIVAYVAASMAIKLAVDVMIKAIVEGKESPMEEGKENNEQTE